MTDLNGCVDIFQNVTDHCSNNFKLASEQCEVPCIISIMTSLKVCYDLLFYSGQAQQFENFVNKCCIVNIKDYCLEFNSKKYEYYGNGH